VGAAGVRFTFDSNILVYAAHATDERHEPAYALVHRASRGQDCVQTLQSLGECYNVLRKRGLAPADAESAVAHYRALFPVVAAEPDVLDDALRVCRAHKIQFWDALMWATAKEAGCRVMLTEDLQDGRNLEGVRIVNPLNKANREFVDLILPLAEH
jgi:predicted nucleic acid-binding protein